MLLVQCSLADQPEEEAIAKFARRGLQVTAPLARHPAHVRFAAQKLQAARSRQIAHESFIVIGFRAAQMMVEMDDG